MSKKKKKVVGFCKAQKVAAQQIPKFLLTASGGLPYSKCLTHIVGVAKESEIPAATIPWPENQDKQP